MIDESEAEFLERMKRQREASNGRVSPDRAGDTRRDFLRDGRRRDERGTGNG